MFAHFADSKMYEINYLGQKIRFIHAQLCLKTEIFFIFVFLGGGILMKSDVRTRLDFS